MSDLTKTEMVLELQEVESDYWRTFDDRDEDEDVTVDITMHVERFVELGQPDQVTVTIEPGDRMNDG